MRRIIRSLLGVILRIFFPRIELAGVERVPSSGPVILAVNHPNGLIDPIFLLCLLPRPVSFLAKAPLFDTPVIGWFVRAMGSIPVYRRQDGAFDPSKNRQTFDRARAILSSGGVIAIFPEGASHDDPKLRPLKTGAARIALGAMSAARSDNVLAVVPVGIYYTAKGIFRSDALLYFGQPIPVASEPLDSAGEPDTDSVRALTKQIEQALAKVTLQADEHEALALVARAESVFSSEQPSTASNLVDRFELRRRLMAGYTTLRARAPERLATISARIDRYAGEVQDAGLDPQTLQRASTPVARGFLDGLRMLVVLVVVLPIAIVGTVINYPIYRLVGAITARLSRDDEAVVATIKMIAGACLFPLWWIIVATAVGLYFGLVNGLVTLIVSPFTGWVALNFFENLDSEVVRLRALTMQRFSRWGFLRLVAERRAINKEILALASEFER
jgi:1-acyl-sn-glycerol-3-phosphate acyltransferase